jgi:hypothetical protein
MVPGPEGDHTLTALPPNHCSSHTPHPSSGCAVKVPPFGLSLSPLPEGKKAEALHMLWKLHIEHRIHQDALKVAMNHNIPKLYNASCCAGPEML